MNPTPSDIYYQPLLTQISLGFVQNSQEFIADQVFPNIPVDAQGGAYRTFDRADWLRSEAQLRAPGAESAGGGWRQSTDTFFAQVYAFHKDNDDQTLATWNNTAAQGDSMDIAATRYVTRQMLLKREATFVSKYFAGGVWTTDQTGATTVATNQFIQWDLANSTPINDVRNQRLAMGELTGFQPNVLVLGPRVFEVLVNHTQILSRIQYTQAAFGSEELLARAFGVDRVLVPHPVQNTAKEGLTASYSFMYPRAALLVYAAPAPEIDMPSAGYTFSWRGYTGMNDMGARIKRFRLERNAVTRIEAEMAFDMKVVSTELGKYFATAVSTAA
jgi:hypothetical protein